MQFLFRYLRTNTVAEQQEFSPQKNLSLVFAFNVRLGIGYSVFCIVVAMITSITALKIEVNRDDPHDAIAIS